MELHRESVFMHFVRAAVLLTVLVAIPGTAVCWNLIPKDFLPQNLFHDSGKNSFDTAFDEQDEDESDAIVTNQETQPDPLKFTSFEQSVATASLPQQPTGRYAAAADGLTPLSQSTQLVDFSAPSSQSFGRSDVSTAVYNDVYSPASHQDSFANRNVPDTIAERQTISGIMTSTKRTGPSKTNLPMLEKELKMLGAQYYRLEKWGSQGDMFRFSCYVSPSMTSRYQKYFQAIDSDEVSVMQRVLEEIKSWKARM